MRELLPGPGHSADNLTADDVVHATYAADGPLLRWNMVSTVDGATTGPDGTSASINNAADHRVFGYLRGWADAVIVGAETARTEGYAALRANRWTALRDGRTDAPLLVILSRGSELPARLAGCSPDEVLLISGDDVQPQEVVDQLRAAGHQRLLLEGGPSVGAQFVRAGVVDELCLTIVPQLVGGSGPRIVHGSSWTQDLTLASLLEEDGTLLTRWTF